jgi:hypothetical protein
VRRFWVVRSTVIDRIDIERDGAIQYWITRRLRS